jgi:hypothetical protein
MTICSTRTLLSFIGAVLVASIPGVANAQAQGEARTASLVKELTEILQQRKLDSIAARHPGGSDVFVAALYFPGQLLVISARTSAPAIVNEKLVRREFRDIYIDLNSASIPESRIMISDGGADGLRSRREPNQPFDSQDAGGKSVRFDGNWREDKMSEQDYMKIFTQADEAYMTALQALVSELKKTS